LVLLRLPVPPGRRDGTGAFRAETSPDTKIPEEGSWTATNAIPRRRARSLFVDNAFILVVPGALAAGLGDALFWWSLALSLVIAFVVTVPVNRLLISRGRGHAVMHELHAH
jgi:Domain of unknown function (DUF4396)